MKKSQEQYWEKWSEDLGKKIEKKFERKVTKSSEYVVNIVVNIVLLLFWRRIIDWFPFITDSISAILPLFYISFVVSIFINFIFLFNDEALTRAILKTISNLIGVVVMICLYYIYPFDFSAYSFHWDIIARIVLIVGIAGTLIGTVVELTKLNKN